MADMQSLRGNKFQEDSKTKKLLLWLIRSTDVDDFVIWKLSLSQKFP